MRIILVISLLGLSACSSYDTYTCKSRPIGGTTFTFEVRDDGSVRNMHIDGRLQLLTLVKAFWYDLDQVKSGCFHLKKVN